MSFTDYTTVKRPSTVSNEFTKVATCVFVMNHDQWSDLLLVGISLKALIMNLSGSISIDFQANLACMEIMVIGFLNVLSGGLISLDFFIVFVVVFSTAVCRQLGRGSC